MRFDRSQCDCKPNAAFAKNVGDEMASSEHQASGSQLSTTRVVEILNNVVTSDELLKDTREIVIRHGEDVYRLRLTAQNKLILTK
jgi:hemin uptake protein HemP